MTRNLISVFALLDEYCDLPAEHRQKVFRMIREVFAYADQELMRVHTCCQEDADILLIGRALVLNQKDIDASSGEGRNWIREQLYLYLSLIERLELKYPDVFQPSHVLKVQHIVAEFVSRTQAFNGRNEKDRQLILP